jgi:lipopolysaccharide transport system ATP-binding protein
MRPIIKVENISKQYSIGGPYQAYGTLRDSIMSAARAPIKKLRGASRSHARRAFWALRDVNFEVTQGEVIGIIGRNGAGKSTLLKILSRITEPTTGRVELYGRVGSLLEVGTGFHPELSGRENIYLSGAIIGMRHKEIERKFDEIVAFSEMENFLDTPVKRYSSGMYMRLAFAIAAHLDPEILIVDEVLAVGDAAFKKKCLGKMGEVAQGGRTVLFVSHSMAAIQQLCTSAILLSAGKITQKGDTENVITYYLEEGDFAQSGEFDLSNHQSRPSNFQSVFRRLRFYNSNDQITSRYFPDDECIVELAIEPPAFIKEPRIVVAIDDHLGRRISTLATYLQPNNIEYISEPCRVRCIIPKLALGSGRYLISLSLSSNQIAFDHIDHAAWFDIEWDNNYGNGHPYHSIYGPVLFPARWTKID